MSNPHNYVGRCQRCGRPFNGNPRKRVSFMREVGNGKFSSDGFNRYYCDRCAKEFRKLAVEFETNVSERAGASKGSIS